MNWSGELTSPKNIPDDCLCDWVLGETCPECPCHGSPRPGATRAPSQTVQAKAAAYLLERKIRVREATGDYLWAEVRGRALYDVRSRAGIDTTWHCSCPARSTCAHILACQAIWAPTAPAWPGPTAADAERGRQLLERLAADTEHLTI